MPEEPGSVPTTFSLAGPMAADTDLTAALELVDKEAEQCLDRASVYHVSAYGWLDADSVDPEYIGHAKWQLEPPFEPDFPALFDEGPAESKPSKDQQLL